ncbi:MAG: FemAB family XrtA/PEP-CTERM system-associated protein [Sphingomonadales bacterium]
MSARVRLLNDSEACRWDAFVATCPQAGFFHRAGWREVIETTFGHRCHYLYAEEAGAITGVLPLVHVSSLLFGKSLVSTAFCVYGGPATVNAEATRTLMRHAEQLGLDLGVDRLEYRNRRPVEPEGHCSSDLYVTFRKKMAPDPQANLLAVPRKQRAMVRKGIKAGLQSEIDQDVDRLFDMYSASVRNLGTPVFPKALFRNLKTVFGDDCEVLTVTSDGQPLSSVMSFFFRDEVLPYYGGGVSRARELAANDFMYWEVMRRACEKGCRLFDFGRSKEGTGSCAFKKHWGFEPEPLHYQYKLPRGGELPEINPLNPKYRLLIGAWKRMPLWLANRVGPMIARNLG